MAYDHEEQEQLDSLKAFWNKYGNLLTWVLIVVLGAYAGYNYWRYHQRTQAAEASVLYDQLQKSAKAQLQWAADHGDDEMKAIARLRIAGILLDEKAYDEGLKLLGGEFLPQFSSAVADRKGDILVAQNKLDEARKAYVTALAGMDKADPGRKLVEVKLESIGGTAPKQADAAAPAAA